MSTSTRETRLREMFEHHADRVLAYASRHVGPVAAQDVVSDVFLVAWRRIDDVPADALPWLLVVARNTIGNRRRSTARQQRLADELAAVEQSAALGEATEVVALRRQSMLAALKELSAPEREALLLTGWDGLSVEQARTVVGCSRRAFELRLHRARSRLRRLLAAEDEPQHPTRTPSVRLAISKEISS